MADSGAGAGARSGAPAGEPAAQGDRDGAETAAAAVVPAQPGLGATNAAGDVTADADASSRRRQQQGQLEADAEQPDASDAPRAEVVVELPGDVSVQKQEAQTAAGGDQPTQTTKLRLPVYTLRFKPLQHPELPVRALFTAIVLFGFQWMYIGVAFNPAQHTQRLSVAVLDCDVGYGPAGAALGAAASVPLGAQLLGASIFNANSSASSSLGWRVYSCPGSQPGVPGCGARANACLQSLRDDVYQGHFWGGLYVPPGTSAAYLSAFPAIAGGGNASAAPPLTPVALELIYTTGRGYSTVPYVTKTVTALVTGLSQQLGQQVLATPALKAVVNPAFLLAPVSLTLLDLAPVRILGLNFAVQTVVSLMWMSGSFVAGVSRQFKSHAELRSMAGHRVTARELLPGYLAKFAIYAAVTFVHAVCLIAVILCIARWSDTDHHGAQFYYSPGYAIAYAWFLGFSFSSISALSMSALGQDRGGIITTVLMVVQLTTSEVFCAEELSNQFFRLGRVMPFRYGMRALRTIFFGACTDKMAWNWGVPCIWNVVGLALVSRHYFKAHLDWDDARRSPLETMEALQVTEWSVSTVG